MSNFIVCMYIVFVLSKTNITLVNFMSSNINNSTKAERELIEGARLRRGAKFCGRTEE